ncbi:hypothetical protein FD755_001993 [Muntiacus reevesi]|uniref:PH domain-containing protein n=1 Tax=Muntiacus reevesi TaxID=9886 RepID=A0A5J5N2T7_MUNRE|nr:hypothetical protein FD755_001993 [Muntiacus reevesi]
MSHTSLLWEFEHNAISPSMRETYLSSAKRKFADSLNEFKFQCIGDAETDDEMCIARSLQEFATVLRNLEDERIRMIENASEVLITPLEKFRKEQIGAAKEAKKKYDKETEKYCGILEKHLNLSSKKKESQLQEADSQVDLVRQHFYEVSLEYVFKVQEVQERKMFEFVEPLLAFLQGLFTFYHHGYELAKDFNDFKTQLTISIQNTRNRFEGTRSEVESLMKKMKENPLEHKTISPYTMEGYLYVQEKRHFGTSWVKHYCTYQRDSKQITMVPFDQKSGGKGGEDESVTLKSCTRRKTDSIEKRFCFDVEAVDSKYPSRLLCVGCERGREWRRAVWRTVVQNKASESPLNKLIVFSECTKAFSLVVGIKQQKGTQSQICTQGECLVNMKAEIRVIMLYVFQDYHHLIFLANHIQTSPSNLCSQKETITSDWDCPVCAENQAFLLFPLGALVEKFLESLVFPASENFSRAVCVFVCEGVGGCRGSPFLLLPLPFSREREKERSAFSLFPPSLSAETLPACNCQGTVKDQKDCNSFVPSLLWWVVGTLWQVF